MFGKESEGLLACGLAACSVQRLQVLALLAQVGALMLVRYYGVGAEARVLLPACLVLGGHRRPGVCCLIWASMCESMAAYVAAGQRGIQR
jgi:hypothetical protein